MSKFSVERTNKFIKISCPRELDAEAAKDFSSQEKKWLSTKSVYVVMDLEKTKILSKEFYHEIIQLKKILKKDGKILCSINLSPMLRRQVKKDGFDQLLSPVNSIAEILAHDAANTKITNRVDVNYLNPFLTATLKTLDIQCNTKGKALKPYLKIEQLPNIAITGVVSLISKGFSGSIALCFQQKVFLKIYENMFSERHDSITTEVQDAASELLNIIYGVAKGELNGKGYDFPQVLPMVLTGEKIRVHQSGLGPAIVVPFETDAGEMHVEIELNKNIWGSYV